jgi:hypothetical protein
MRIFQDKTGQPWELDLTVGHFLAIKSELGLNLMDNPETLPSGVEKMVGVIWITCHDQAKAKGLGPVEFAKRLDGKILSDAWEKWMAEYIDFFAHQSPAQGQLLALLWDASQKAERARADLTKQASLSICSDLQELLESIPDHSRPG